MSSAAILIITDLLVKPLHSQCRCHYLKDTNIEACFILAYSHFNLEFFEIPWDSYKMGFCREGDFVVARYLNCFPFSLNGSGRHGIYPICILLAALFSRPKVIIVPKVILYIVYFLFFFKNFFIKNDFHKPSTKMATFYWVMQEVVRMYLNEGFVDREIMKNDIWNQSEI